jgi:DNA polymerase-3 subunit epsilon
MYLFFDTETTGFVDKSLPLEDESQPKLLQLGAILADESLEIRSSINLYVKHPDFTIDESGGAFKVNGITQEHIEKFGVSLEVALSVFYSLHRLASFIVAHNHEFDAGIMACNGFEATYVGLDIAKMPEKLCTQKMARDIGVNGRLTDMYKHFTGKELKAAHTAIADAKACYDIFKIMKGKQDD